MSTTARNSRVLAQTQLDFVRYVAQYTPIAPRLVFRRLKIIGAFFALSLLGAAVALAVIGLDIATSEPGRLLATFGFVTAVLITGATIFSAGLLLWGGFISQYVANLDQKAADAETLELDFELVPTEPVEANDEVLRAVGEDMKAVAEAIEQAVDQPLSGTARDLRKELASIQRRLKEIEQSLSPAGHERMAHALKSLSVRVYEHKLTHPNDDQPPRAAARMATR